MNKIEGTERDALILQILKRIDADTQVVGAPERINAWERGWSEARQKFRNKPVVESLIPAFIHVDQPVRWKQEFYQPDAEYNELMHVRFVQDWIGNHLEDCAHIAEFGCGTGFNLVAMAQRLPGKYFVGFDFSPAAVELVNQVGWALQLPIVAYPCDMLYPGPALLPDSGIFTFGAIEQLAGDFTRFMEYLLVSKPKIVVHVEPCIELLDENNLVDYLAIMFMKKRGYTAEFLPWLQNDPRVELIAVERTGFGSLMIDSYNLIVWRPK
jgi:hypothetical protein